MGQGAVVLSVPLQTDQSASAQAHSMKVPSGRPGLPQGPRGTMGTTGDNHCGLLTVSWGEERVLRKEALLQAST